MKAGALLERVKDLLEKVDPEIEVIAPGHDGSEYTVEGLEVRESDFFGDGTQVVRTLEVVQGVEWKPWSEETMAAGEALHRIQRAYLELYQTKVARAAARFGPRSDQAQAAVSELREAAQAQTTPEAIRDMRALTTTEISPGKPEATPPAKRSGR